MKRIMGPAPACWPGSPGVGSRVCLSGHLGAGLSVRTTPAKGPGRVTELCLGQAGGRVQAQGYQARDSSWGAAPTLLKPGVSRKD